MKIIYCEDIIERTVIQRHTWNNNGFIVTRYAPNKNKPIFIINSNILEDEYEVNNTTGVIRFGAKDINKVIEIEYNAIKIN